MSKIDVNGAQLHFRKNDPIMAELLARALAATNPLELPVPKKSSEYFTSIVMAIISQQISVKAADAVQRRVIDFLGGTITPQTVMDADTEKLKSCGLSYQKTKYIVHNANAWAEVPVDDFVSMPDELVIKELCKLYGIGRWTAEMFLIFSLARPDVFSYGDLGLMQGLYESYNYKPHYVRKIRTTVDTWAPHRTLASLALWYSKDNEPVLL